MLKHVTMPVERKKLKRAPVPRKPLDKYQHHGSARMVFTKIDSKREQNDFEREVVEVKKWWTSPRFRKILRYFDEGVVG
jgi:hypothetical protein